VDAQLRCCHFLLQIADEERSRRFGMVLVKISFEWSELVVVQVEARIPGCHFNFAAEEKFVTRHFQRFIHIFRLFKANDGHPVRALTSHLDSHHFAVFLVFVKQAILEAGV